jgi:hypothetical protein
MQSTLKIIVRDTQRTLVQDAVITITLVHDPLRRICYPAALQPSALVETPTVRSGRNSNANYVIAHCFVSQVGVLALTAYDLPKFPLKMG